MEHAVPTGILVALSPRTSFNANHVTAADDTVASEGIIVDLEEEKPNKFSIASMILNDGNDVRLSRLKEIFSLHFGVNLSNRRLCEILEVSTKMGNAIVAFRHVPGGIFEIKEMSTDPVIHVSEDAMRAANPTIDDVALVSKLSDLSEVLTPASPAVEKVISDLPMSEPVDLGVETESMKPGEKSDPNEKSDNLEKKGEPDENNNGETAKTIVSDGKNGSFTVTPGQVAPDRFVLRVISDPAGDAYFDCCKKSDVSH